ncbi:TPA: DUF1320 domain-containing protein [Escherichia coli]|nr:DUF1320 domain-containing protein [Escherichia coli]
MGIYITSDDLLATDGSLVWNMAIDKSTGELDTDKVNTAIDDADAEINSILARRYKLPITFPTGMPRMLHRAATSIAIYWLSERDNQITDLIQKRYDDAIKTLKEFASGARDLGLPTGDDGTASAETDNGKLIIFSDNERLFTRKKLSGVL